MNVFALLGLLGLIALITWVGTQASDKNKSRLSSGKVIPDDDGLRLLSIDQLITDYTAEELEELADIAISHLKDEPKRVREQWEDLLRRVYEASDEKCGIYH